MPDPGCTRSDTCSMRAVALHAHCARAASDVPSADGRPPAASGWLTSLGHDVARILDAGGAWPVNGHHSRPTGAGR